MKNKTKDWFVGKFATGTTYRPMRRRKRTGKLAALMPCIEEEYSHNRFIKPRGPYKKVGAYVGSREAARELKKLFEAGRLK